MAVPPLSGKSGFLIGQQSTGSEVHIPIYFWNVDSRRELTRYRLSNSQNYPTRFQGVYNQTITIRAVSAYNTDYMNHIMNTASVNFIIGWNNLILGKQYYFTIHAMLTQITFNYIYTRSNQPNFIWTATFLLCAPFSSIILQERDIPETPSDFVLCATPQCLLDIVEVEYPLGADVIVPHVRNASLTFLREFSPYRVSNSQNLPIPTLGVLDANASLTVDGDFDRWFDRMNILNVPFEYFFDWGPDTGNWHSSIMRVESITNMHANVQTGELVSANVNLEATGG